MQLYEPEELQTATLINGLPTCVFRPKSYPRVVTQIQLGNSATSAVNCYRGVLSSTAVEGNLLGTANTFTGIIEVPAGQAFYVQWSAAGVNVRDAFARVYWARVNDLLNYRSGISNGTWSGSAGYAQELSELTNTSTQLIRTTETITGPRNFGPFYVGDNPYLFFRQDAALNIQTRIVFSADAAGAQTVYDRFVFSNATTADAAGPIPVRGPYVTFEVELSAYPNLITLQSYIVPSRMNVHSRAGGANSLIAETNNTVVGLTNEIYPAVAVRWGRATWTADLRGGANFICYLIATEFGGATYVLDYVDQQSRNRPRAVFLPSLPITAQMFNLNGANFDAFCLLHYHEDDY